MAWLNFVSLPVKVRPHKPFPMGSSLGKLESVNSPTEGLTRISKAIEDNTKLLADRLRSRGLEAPSYQPNGLADFPLGDADGEALRAREEIVALTQELHDLVLGPREALKNMAWDVSEAPSMKARRT